MNTQLSQWQIDMIRKPGNGTIFDTNAAIRLIQIAITVIAWEALGEEV